MEPLAQLTNADPLKMLPPSFGMMFTRTPPPGESADAAPISKVNSSVAASSPWRVVQA